MEIRFHPQLIASCCGVAVSLAMVAPVAAGESAAAIRHAPLNERAVVQIVIGRDVPTTVAFPSALTAIEGANVTTGADTPAPVLLAYTPGQPFFSVRALEAGAKGAVNVVWQKRTFVLRFAEGAEPSGSVVFHEEPKPERGRIAPKRNSPENLLALLDRAKAHALISATPDLAPGVEHAAPGDVCYYRDFRVIVRDVFRFEAEDTLVFKLRFENDALTPLYYQPQRLATRIGLNVYYPSLVDASGVVPPRSATTAWLAITGNAAGGRAHLSLKNTFSIVVPRVERDAKLIVPE